MCGIIAYFGSAGNSLTRLLSAMSAIIYRAPDSTGVGIFGDDLEPIRTCKTVGSVIKLSEYLMDFSAYPNRPEQLMALWHSETDSSDVSHQLRLLEFEELSTETFDELTSGKNDYLSFDELFDPFRKQILFPGYPGRPGYPPPVFIRSPNDMKRTIQDMTMRYDLSYVVIQSLIRKSLREQIENRFKTEPSELKMEDILNTFDRIFESIFLQEKLPRPIRSEYGEEQKNPYIVKYLWRYMKDTPIRIPPDYDRDAVKCMFRFLDAALITSLRSRPELLKEIQQELEILWPKSRLLPDIDWRTLYWAEKGANVYGWAAAASLAYMQKIGLPPDIHASVQFGHTDPLSLNFFAQPVVSHGRWAMQSAVTAKNAHPFLDAQGDRVICINGQFDPEIEAGVKEFIEQIEGLALRSDNSSEYFAFLWGYYFDHISREKQRYDAIQEQMQAGLTDYSIGSQTVDFNVYRNIKDKNLQQLDELSFREAVRRMSQKGGQIAAIGMSVYSPRCLYVASHNRPAFIVYRPDTDDVMLVSDINAAMGLFPQHLTHQKTLELNALRNRHSEDLRRLRETETDRKTIEALKKEQENEEKEFLEAVFRVHVIPLEGEEIFARIRTEWENGRLNRKITLMDFNENPLPDIKRFTTVLTPLWIRKDLFRSFFETHLHEIPDRLESLLSRYLPDDTVSPAFELNEHFFQRRFGDRLGSLKRIVVAGMGSAYHVGIMSRMAFGLLAPHVEVVVVQPIEIENVASWFIPDTDLVVLMSWSSTTADMIELAKALQQHNVAMIGVTEKLFSDMALIAQRSGGLIWTGSGEEVTVSAVKSPFCMMMCLHLLALWISEKLGGQDQSREFAEKLYAAKNATASLLGESTLNAFIGQLLHSVTLKDSCVIFDALDPVGTALEASYKIEENSWVVIGKVFDYSDLYEYTPPLGYDGNQVIVNATHEARLSDALNLMKRLHLSGIEFTAVTYDHSMHEEMNYLSGGNCFTLPKLADCCQPFADLIFYYQFAYRFGVAHGRQPDEFPRNRAKSVTISRSRTQQYPSAEKEWLFLMDQYGSFKPAEEAERPAMEPILWEKNAYSPYEENYYRELVKLSKIFYDAYPLGRLTTLNREPDGLFSMLSEWMDSDRSILLIPQDQTAEAVAKTVTDTWKHFLECGLRTANMVNDRFFLSENTFSIVLSSVEPNVLNPEILEKQISGPILWIGPSGGARRTSERSAGDITFNEEFKHARFEALYAVCSYVFISALEKFGPEKADTLKRHFSLTSSFVDMVLNHDGLRRQIHQAVYDNRGYRTAFFISSSGGCGVAWTNTFDRTASMNQEHHYFGESAHGPIVTVDDSVESKYIPLEQRNRMVVKYGEEQIEEWERLYLGGETVDTILHQTSKMITDQLITAFYAEGRWYLPVLSEDYDQRKDNLIILDATRFRHLNHALDELSSYGCRYARIALLTQELFHRNKKGFRGHPISHLISIPALPFDEKRLSVSEFLLPFVIGPIGMAMAASASKIRNCAFTPVNKAALFTGSFGPAGELLLRHGITIDQLSSYMIDPLKSLAPVIRSIKGAVRYRIQEIREREELDAFEKDIAHFETIVENFEMTRHYSPHLPYYLICTDADRAEGTLDGELSLMPSSSPDYRWTDPAGKASIILNSHIPDICENLARDTLLAFPLLNRHNTWLYYVHPEYVHWDHRAPFPDQLHTVLSALGKESALHHRHTPRYLKLVGRFNDNMSRTDIFWNDRMLALCEISLLFGKGSREVAAVIVDRVNEIMARCETNEPHIAIDDILDRLETMWDRIDMDLSDGQRWNRLCELICPAGAFD